LPRCKLGLYAAKVLKGTPQADIPIEQATKFEVVINLKTAAALRLVIRRGRSRLPTR
jgi:putative ABC transport system substrate-binding protein